MFLHLRHDLCPVLLHLDVLFRHPGRSLLYWCSLVRSPDRGLLHRSGLVWHPDRGLPCLDVLFRHLGRSLLHWCSLVRSPDRSLLHRSGLVWHLDRSLLHWCGLVSHRGSPVRGLRYGLSLHGRLSRSWCAWNRWVILCVCTLRRVKTALWFLVPGGSRVENWHRKTCLIIGVVVVYERRRKRCL